MGADLDFVSKIAELVIVGCFSRIDNSFTTGADVFGVGQSLDGGGDGFIFTDGAELARFG